MTTPGGATVTSAGGTAPRAVVPGAKAAVPGVQKDASLQSGSGDDRPFTEELAGDVFAEQLPSRQSGTDSPLPLGWAAALGVGGFLLTTRRRGLKEEAPS